MKSHNPSVKTTTKRKGGRGTHGSTTKAGKVRQQTPKIPKTVMHKPTNPRTRNRRKYENRVILRRESGQNWRRKQ